MGRGGGCTLWPYLKYDRTSFEQTLAAAIGCNFRNISTVFIHSIDLFIKLFLGESCAHVGIVLIYVEYAVRLRDSKTCTEEKAYSCIPGYSQVEYKEINDIDFSAPKTIKKRLNDMTNGEEQVSFKKYSTYPSPSKEEKKFFFQRINNSGSKPAILSILPGFAKKYEPSVISNKFPTSMSDLFDVENVELSLGELQERCRTIIFTVTQNQVENVVK